MKRRQESPGSNLAAVFAVFPEKEKREKEEGMVEPPRNEGPGSPMPEAADEKNDEGVAKGFKRGATRAAQGNINVVAKPGCQ